MKEIKATASDHMRRDLDDGGTWECRCEACVHMRSLIGVKTVLDVRPLVRALEQAAAELEHLPAGPERDRVRNEYLDLYDRLAAVVTE